MSQLFSVELSEMDAVLRVLVAAQAFDRAGVRIFAPHGLTTAQFNVLNLLSAQKTGLRASDLARGLIVDPSNITGLLKRMSKKKWIEELENTADRRQRVVGLTSKGRAVWSKAFSDYSSALNLVSAAVSAGDRRVTAKALDRWIEKVREISPQ